MPHFDVSFPKLQRKKHAQRKRKYFGVQIFKPLLGFEYGKWSTLGHLLRTAFLFVFWHRAIGCGWRVPCTSSALGTTPAYQTTAAKAISMPSVGT